MKKRAAYNLLLISLILLILSVSLVSAFSINDFFKNLFGKKISGKFTYIPASGVCNCNSCIDCSNALNNDSCRYAILTQNISESFGTGFTDPRTNTCIIFPVSSYNNPLNKSFNCNNHKITNTAGLQTPYQSKAIVLGSLYNSYRVENCEISGFNYGIVSFHEARNIAIVHNIIKNNIYGVELATQTNGRVTNSKIIFNIFENNRFGVRMNGYAGTDNDTVWLNTFVNNTDTGLYVMGFDTSLPGTMNNYSFNNFTNHTASSNSRALYLEAGKGILQNNSLCGNSIDVYYRSFPGTFTDNTCDKLTVNSGSNQPIRFCNYACDGRRRCATNSNCQGDDICIGGYCVACTPKTCQDLGKECGTWGDSCRNNVTCNTCQSGTYCNTTGQCTSQLCSLNQKRCSGNINQTCFDSDSDGINEWVGNTACSSGAFCNSITGQCANQICTLNQKRCSGNINQTCLDSDSDGINEWFGDDACEEACTNGICVASACTPIANLCQGKQCGRFANGTCGEVVCGSACQAGQDCDEDLGLCIATDTEPEITLISPDDLTEAFPGIINFTFSSTDDSSTTLKCSLWLNNKKNSTMDINNNAQGKFSINLTKGDYNWQIKCNDSINNMGVSETRSLGTNLICSVGILISGTQCKQCDETGTDYFFNDTKCPAGKVCNSTGSCANIEDCTDTCADLDRECNNFTICGSIKNCGNCTGGETCKLGTCEFLQNCNPGAVATNTKCKVCDDAGYNYFPDDTKCSSNKVCNSTGSCVLDYQCVDTCSDYGYECGMFSICGNMTNCGPCTGGTCSAGICLPASSQDEDEQQEEDLSESEGGETEGTTEKALLGEACIDDEDCEEGKCIEEICEKTGKSIIVWVILIILGLAAIAVVTLIILQYTRNKQQV